MEGGDACRKNREESFLDRESSGKTLQQKIKKSSVFTLTDDLLVTQSSDCDSGTCTMPEGNMEEELKEMQSDGKLCVTFSMDDSTDNEAVTCSKNG